MTLHIKDLPATGLLWFGNCLVRIPISASDHADGLSVVEQWAPFGDSPPLHIHDTQDEAFVVLSGRLRIRLDGRDIHLGAGDRALAPRGSTHSYRVESAEGAHFLAITVGADFETMVRAASRPAERADLPAAMAPTPEAVAALTALCAASSIRLVGAPLS